MAAKPPLGSSTVLAQGTGQFTLLPKVLFWYVQNQDIYPLKISFLGSRFGTFTSLVLTPAPIRGGAGGYLDSIGFGYFDPLGFQLDSSVADAAFGSGQSQYQPCNSFPYPANPGPLG